jgi:menaquinone-dependent protoporphyrinogen oxidase
VLDVATLVGPPPEIGAFGAVLVAASVHMGRHEREMVRFVRAHRGELARVPAAFISVSLTEAGAEDPGRSAAQRAEASRHVALMIEAFFDDTGWHPAHVKPVAGALLYTQYGRLMRFILKRIVRSQGGSTDTTSDHEYTDWPSLARFVDEFIRTALPPEAGPFAPAERPRESEATDEHAR